MLILLDIHNSNGKTELETSLQTCTWLNIHMNVYDWINNARRLVVLAKKSSNRVNTTPDQDSVLDFDLDSGEKLVSGHCTKIMSPMILMNW